MTDQIIKVVEAFAARLVARRLLLVQEAIGVPPSGAAFAVDKAAFVFDGDAEHQHNALVLY